ncbi:MAG: hypothetical protein KDK63_04720, partial [Chlamydiia bacterium]|nr:hypothetical protein [Chlamydiia bacterium]
REALQNAVLHTDYSIRGCTIQVAIFDTRIEITNPGSFVHGMTLELAKTGVSILRNRVIGKVFKELDLIEQWGSGIKRIINISKNEGIKAPLFEELNNQFRVTLYSRHHKAPKTTEWENVLIDYLKAHKKIQPKEAAKLWGITERGARKRLSILLDKGSIIRLALSERDPLLCYALST